MSISNVVLVATAAAMLLALLLAWKRQYRNLFAILLFLGVAGIAILVTVVQVTQYRADKAATPVVTQSSPGPQPLATAAPPMQPAAQPVLMPPPPPMMRGPTGSAAPPVAHNPYLGKS